MEMGKEIRRLWQDRGLTQEALADRLSVTRQAVSNWECGKTQPDIETLHRIADVLDITVEELIYGEKRQLTVVHNHYTTQQVTETVGKGVSFGAVLAMVISYVKWQSIGWAILHGLLNWGYVIYYIIRYGWS